MNIPALASNSFIETGLIPHISTLQKLRSMLCDVLQNLRSFRQGLLSRQTAQLSVSSSSLGAYLMKLSVGTPLVEMVMIVGTGSDFVWMQCKPCSNCFDQKSPPFDPKASSTYKLETCASAVCLSLQLPITWDINCREDCRYSYSFVDGSSTEGTLAKDTVMLGSTYGKPFVLPRTIIGCGTYNDGNFGGNGIVGLGCGAILLTSRMKNTTAGKFSCCFAPTFSNYASIMNFGSKGIVYLA